MRSDIKTLTYDCGLTQLEGWSKIKPHIHENVENLTLLVMIDGVVSFPAHERKI